MCIIIGINIKLCKPYRNVKIIIIRKINLILIIATAKLNIYILCFKGVGRSWYGVLQFHIQGNGILLLLISILIGIHFRHHIHRNSLSAFKLIRTLIIKGIVVIIDIPIFTICRMVKIFHMQSHILILFKILEKPHRVFIIYIIIRLKVVCIRICGICCDVISNLPVSFNVYSIRKHTID